MRTYCDSMESRCASELSAFVELVEQFELVPLQPTVAACQALARDDAPFDVAVLGQFNSGKSSVLNAIVGHSIFPVGALPATAVITRAQAGEAEHARVEFLDGHTEDIPLARIAEFVTESSNPENKRRVKLVDVFTPALADWPGIRLVDTPGLGSLLAHNTQATLQWLPQVAMALVVTSAERPLSEEDARLLDEAHRYAGQVILLLNKSDLLSRDEQQAMVNFVAKARRRDQNSLEPVRLFSTRHDSQLCADSLKTEILQPLVNDVASARGEALRHKLAHLHQSSRSYLEVAIQAAEKTDSQRDQLRRAVFDETVTSAMLADELQLVEQRVASGSRKAFEKWFLPHQETVTTGIRSALATEMPRWIGNLAEQSRHYEAWLADRLTQLLGPISAGAPTVAIEQLADAQRRVGRVVEAFRDRLSRNIREQMGITVTAPEWPMTSPALAAVPVRVGRAFMVHWELLWWALPMRIVGPLFRRHTRSLVAREVEKNLYRLAADWSSTVNDAIAGIRQDAQAWSTTELATLERLLAGQSERAPELRSALARLDAMTHDK